MSEKKVVHGPYGEVIFYEKSFALNGQVLWLENPKQKEFQETLLRILHSAFIRGQQTKLDEIKKALEL